MTDHSKRNKKDPATSKGKLKTVRQGEINYIDASSLSRSLTMPKKNYPIMLAILAVAVVAACGLGFAINYNIVHGEDRLKAQVLEIANRGVDTEVPKLTDFVDYSDADFAPYMESAGYAYVDMNEINKSPDFTIDYFKLPSDMSVEEAEGAYTNGISSLDTETAVKLLSGSWRLTVNRAGGFSYNIRYADFESDNPNSAIQKAMEKQGLADTTLTESGKDRTGNQFQSGEVEIDGYHYTWTVSVCKLKEAYRVSGIPGSSQYVGVRLNYYRSAQ